MKNIIVLLCLTCIIAIGCNLNNKNNKENINTATSVALSDNQIPPILYKGAMALGHEAEYFVDCETKEEWWVIYENRDELQKKYQDITMESSNPFDEIYAEIKGYLEDAPEDGFAAEYDKILKIVEVVHLNSLDGGNDCSRQSTDVN